MDKMKKLALMLPAMRLGGAEKIALNFIDDLKKHFDITLILNEKEGVLLPFVPDGVKVLEDKLWHFGRIVRYDVKHFKLISLFKDLVYYLRIKRTKRKEKNYRYLVQRTPKITEKFDVAISYVANVSTQIFSLEGRIDADKKIAWIHGETTELKDVKLFSKIYQKFDNIFAVSGVTKEHFIKKFPLLTAKTDVYYNPINAEKILRGATEKVGEVFDDKVTDIFSIGRVTPEKGFDMMPGIVSTLKEKGYKVKWYLVGDGTMVDKIKLKAERLGVSDEVVLLGAKANPYPYLSRCDIYVQPSYEEGYSTTICEAGILGKAIIGTSSSGGIREQIVDGVSGIIAEPTVESLAEKIAYLIDNPEKRIELETNVKKVDFAHERQIEKLLNVVGE